jgi:HEAT repeat protein
MAFDLLELLRQHWRTYVSPAEPLRAEVPRGAVKRDLEEHFRLLARTWRERLARALSLATGRQTLHIRGPAGELAELEARWLLPLDERLRQSRYHRWPEGPAVDFPWPPVAMPSPDTEAFAFVAGCDWSGWMRGAALETLPHWPGRLATALALIRCDDWVEPVRTQAQARLAAILRTDGTAKLLALASLLAALKGRQRFMATAWPALVAPALADPDGATARWEATGADDAQVRLFAFDLVAKHDPERAIESRWRAVADANARIARWGLEQAHAAQDPALCELVERALAHAAPSVRVAAARLLGEAFGREARADLERLLFDPARPPRDAAAWWLRHWHQADALDAWREALAADDPSRARIALAALADHATTDDADRLRPWLADPRPTARCDALRAFVRAKPADTFDRLRDALADRSPRVARHALALFARHPGELDHERLSFGYRGAGASTRPLLLRAAGRLEAWRGLALLIEWIARGDADEPLARLLDAHFPMQLRRASYNILRPGPTQRAPVEDALRAAGDRLDPAKREAVERLLRETATP